MRKEDLMRAVKSMPLLQYFFFAFLISWLFWLPLACSAAGILPFKLPGWLFFVGGVGPMAAAFIRAYQEGGVRRMGELLGRLFRWRLPVRLYLIAAFVPPALVLLVLVVLLVAFGGIPQLEFSSPGEVLAIFLVSFLVLPVEELGWRGYALPRLQARYGALSSCLILGVLWGLWHAPLFWLQPERAAGFSILSTFVGFVAIVCAFSVVYGWLYNSSRGSVLLTTLFHASINASQGLYHSTHHEHDIGALFAYLGLYLALAVFIVIRYGHRNLSRGERVTA